MAIAWSHPSESYSPFWPRATGLRWSCNLAFAAVSRQFVGSRLV